MNEIIKHYCRDRDWHCVERLGRSSWRLRDSSHQDYVVKVAATQRERFFLSNQAHWQQLNDTLSAGSFIELLCFDSYDLLLSHYIVGQSLAELIRAQWQENSAKNTNNLGLANVLWKLQQAIEKLHLSGVVHGDLKPSNVLYRQPQVALLDFANARTAHSDDSKRAFYSYSRHFSLPEQKQGMGCADIEKDQYSFLCILEAAMRGQVVQPDWQSASPLAGVFDQSIERYLKHCHTDEVHDHTWRLNNRLVDYCAKRVKGATS